MISGSIEILGLDALQRKLKELPKTVQKKTLRAALKDGARPIAAAAIANAKGSIKRAIKVRAMARLRRGTLGVRIVAKAKRSKGQISTYFADWVEFGHKFAPGKNGKPLRVQLDNGAWATLPTSGEVRAHPYMRPAFDSQKNAAVSAFSTSLARGIEEAAKEA